MTFTVITLAVAVTPLLTFYCHLESAQCPAFNSVSVNGVIDPLLSSGLTFPGVGATRHSRKSPALLNCCRSIALSSTTPTTTTTFTCDCPVVHLTTTLVNTKILSLVNIPTC